MKRALLGCGLAAALCVTGAALASKRADAGSFLVRLSKSGERAPLDHPGYVGARGALWDCWQASRPCEVSLSIEYSRGTVSRDDALLDVSANGVRSILLREYGSTGTLPTPRRYKGLERIPLVRGDWDAPALPETDTHGPAHWRLRFVDGDFVRGAGGEEQGDSHDIQVW